MKKVREELAYQIELSHKFISTRHKQVSVKRKIQIFRELLIKDPESYSGLLLTATSPIMLDRLCADIIRKNL